MAMAQLRTADRLLEECGTLDAVTDDLIRYIAVDRPNDLPLLRSACGKLAGAQHPATIAVMTVMARSRDHTEGARDRRPRALVLEGANWHRLLDVPAVHSLPLGDLRLVDHFFNYCAKHGVSHVETGNVLDFDRGRADPRRLYRLRNSLREIYGMHHPIVHVVERAASIKSKDRREATVPKPTVGQGKRALEYSIPEEELPVSWQKILARLAAGQRIGGRKAAPTSVESMRMQARCLLWAARQADLPEEFSFEALQAYDRALEARETRASTRGIAFGYLCTLGSFLGAQEAILENAKSVAGFYERLARNDLPMKEDRLAALPDIAAVFSLAHDLLVQAKTEKHATRRSTLYTDAGALALLSLIPFRNQDTVLLWGRDLTYCDGRYRLDRTITKTGTSFTGKLHSILDPFIDALILRGRHEAFLPQLRHAAIESEAPVFPKSDGSARSVAGLSQRWRSRIGTGSVINRTRIHTLLGDMGPDGVRAALALCAQRSYKTAQHYQAEALSRRQMNESQAVLSATLPLSNEELADRFEGI